MTEQREMDEEEEAERNRWRQARVAITSDVKLAEASNTGFVGGCNTLGHSPMTSELAFMRAVVRGVLSAMTECQSRRKKQLGPREAMVGGGTRGSETENSC